MGIVPIRPSRDICKNLLTQRRERNPFQSISGNALDDGTLTQERINSFIFCGQIVGFSIAQWRGSGIHQSGIHRLPSAVGLTIAHMAITFILFPLYIYPIANAWSKVFEQIKAKPNLIFDIVININNGPGSAANHPNSDWVNGISQLHSYNNTRLLGYVHVSRAERNYTAVAGDIEVWASWANYAAQNISMDGIFFDEAPSVGTTSELTYMKNATTFARNEMAISESSSPIIVFNPGTTVPDDFYDIADYIVALEETYAEYSKVDLSSVSSSVASKSIFKIGRAHV